MLRQRRGCGARSSQSLSSLRLSCSCSSRYWPLDCLKGIGRIYVEWRFAMNERQWELYRLSVVETWSESPYKRAVSAAIEHKLMVMGQDTVAREPDNSNASAVHSRTRRAVA